MLHNLFLLPTKFHLIQIFIFCCSGMFFVNYAPKFKYQTGHSKVNQFSGYKEIRASLGEVRWPSYLYLHCNLGLTHSIALCPMQSMLVHVRNILLSSVHLKHFCKCICVTEKVFPTNLSEKLCINGAM